VLLHAARAEGIGLAVFCGLRPSWFGATRMLLAGHIKPWKDSTPAERLDPRNGLIIESLRRAPAEARAGRTDKVQALKRLAGHTLAKHLWPL
jgi:hypothetical protein